jgi:hypothetical protein
MKRAGLLLGAVALSALQYVSVPAKAEDQAVLQRLDKLEKENADLRERLKRVENKSSVAARPAQPAPQTASRENPQVNLQDRYDGPPPNQNVPLKAPVQYVRVCSMYGEAFYYIPGTNACIKFGGYVRLQVAGNANGNGVVLGADAMAGQGRRDRFDTNDVNYEARAVVSVDVRAPTDLGTLRGYFRFGPDVNTPVVGASTPTMFWDRGYIQFVGFTVGKQRSFFDIFEPFSSYTYGNPRTTGDTDLVGAIMAGYTFWAGNGFSASIAAEDPGAHELSGVANMAMGELGLGFLTTNNGLAGQCTFACATALHGFSVPDIIANAKYEQAWGYVAASGALHQVAGAYYGPVNSTANGHPSDTWGYAASAAVKVFVPGGPGDWIGGDFAASQGAPGFVTKGAVWQLYGGNHSAGFAWLPDGVYDNTGIIPATGSAIQRTKAWSFNGAYQHVWNPTWKTSLYGGFTRVSFDQNAINMINQHLPTPATAPGVACSMPVEGAVAPPLNVNHGENNSCSPNFSFWQVGTRTQWNPRPWLDLGIEVLYTRLNSAYAGPNVLVGGNGAQPTSFYTIGNQNVISVLGRAQLQFDVGQ